MAVSSVLTIPREKRYIAIAEIIIFSAIQIVQFLMKFTQEWRHWHHDKRKSYARCFLYAWCGMLGMLAQRMYEILVMSITDSHSADCRVSDSYRQLQTRPVVVDRRNRPTKHWSFATSF